MNSLVKQLFQKDIIKDKNVFFLEKALPVNEGLSSVEVAGIVKNVQQIVNQSGERADRQRIEDSLWSIRKQILDQPGSSRKMALCISIDLVINKEFQREDEDRSLLKLISTLVVQYL